MESYIERNLAEIVIKKLAESDCTPFDKQEALDNLCSIPTADVQKVKHGKWFFTDFYDSRKNPIYQCSVCMKEVADHYIDNHKYCLHCGAIMDGE